MTRGVWGFGMRINSLVTEIEYDNIPASFYKKYEIISQVYIILAIFSQNSIEITLDFYTEKVYPLKIACENAWSCLAFSLTMHLIINKLALRVIDSSLL